MNAIVKLASLETKMFFRDRLSMFWTFLFPVVMIGLFGSMFVGDNMSQQAFAEYFVPSWIGVNIVTTSFFTLGTVLTNYRETGVLRRYQSTPLQPWKILAAHTFQGTVIFAISAMLLMVFGMLLYDLTLPAYIGSTLLSLLISILAFFPFALFLTSLAKKHSGCFRNQFIISKPDAVPVRGDFSAGVNADGSSICSENTPALLRHSVAAGDVDGSAYYGIWP